VAHRLLGPEGVIASSGQTTSDLRAWNTKGGTWVALCVMCAVPGPLALDPGAPLPRALILVDAGLHVPCPVRLRARRSRVPRVVERLMYDDCATLVVVFVRRSLPGRGTVERAARLGVAGPSPARLETRTKESMGRASRRVFLAKPQEDAARPAGGRCFRVSPRPSRGVAYDAW
jgi:hypothetical protein